MQFGSKATEQQANYIFLGTYVPISTVDIPNNAIFPATTVPPSSVAEYCKELWNVTTPSAAALQNMYHFTQDDIANSTRIIFSQGQYDPTTSIGPLPFPHTSDRNATKILYVSDMAYREDLVNQ